MAIEQAVATTKRREAGGQFQSQGGTSSAVSFTGYQTDGFYDEMFDDDGAAAARLPAALSIASAASRPTT